MRWTASTEELLRLERLVSELSASFINMPAAQVDAAIVEALRRIVELLGLDRSTLSIVSRETGTLETFHSWAAEGIPAVRPGPIPVALGWAIARARSGKAIVFAHLDDFPPEAAEDRDWYGRNGLRSHVGVPVIVAGELFAILGFGTLRTERTWPQEVVERLQLVGNMFGSALARRQAHEELERALAFERLLVDVSASLITQPAHDPHRALRSIGEFLELDRAALWTLSPDGTRFEVTHAWHSDGVEPSPAAVGEAMLPDVFRNLVTGNVVSIPSVDDLPAESLDRPALEAARTRSMVAVPLMVDGFVVGALSLAAVHRRREWPAAIVARVRLMGEVFASVLTRQRAAREVHQAQSETAQYRERLAHLVRVHTVGEMSAAIAHEVNQPLMAIENYAQAAARRLAPNAAPDDAKVHELLGKIGTQAARAGDVLKRLRSIVRKHESEASLFDVAALVTETMGLVEMESRLRDVRIEVVVPEELPRVYADEVQVQQVLLNLARNGIEAMEAVPAGDKVLRVEVSTLGAELSVRVIDRGQGISQADAAHLFEPFYSTKAQGLGIGLAICRSIIEAHGGKLEYVSGADCGTAFAFTLPIAP